MYSAVWKREGFILPHYDTYVEVGPYPFAERYAIKNGEGPGGWYLVWIPQPVDTGRTFFRRKGGAVKPPVGHEGRWALSSMRRNVGLASGSWEGAASPFMRLAEHLGARFALGTSKAYLVGDNPTCSFSTL